MVRNILLILFVLILALTGCSASSPQPIRQTQEISSNLDFFLQSEGFDQESNILAADRSYIIFGMESVPDYILLDISGFSPHYYIFIPDYNRNRWVMYDEYWGDTSVNLKPIKDSLIGPSGNSYFSLINVGSQMTIKSMNGPELVELFQIDGVSKFASCVVYDKLGVVYITNDQLRIRVNSTYPPGAQWEDIFIADGVTDFCLYQFGNLLSPFLTIAFNDRTVGIKTDLEIIGYDSQTYGRIRALVPIGRRLGAVVEDGTELRMQSSYDETGLFWNPEYESLFIYGSTAVTNINNISGSAGVSFEVDGKIIITSYVDDSSPWMTNPVFSGLPSGSTSPIFKWVDPPGVASFQLIGFYEDEGQLKRATSENGQLILSSIFQETILSFDVERNSDEKKNLVVGCPTGLYSITSSSDYFDPAHTEWFIPGTEISKVDYIKVGTTPDIWEFYEFVFYLEGNTLKLKNL